MSSQHSEPNLHSTHFHFSIEGWIVLWPQKGEIGERTVSGELGEQSSDSGVNSVGVKLALWETPAPML